MNIYRLLLCAAVLTCACKKDLSLGATDFTVAVENADLSLGDTARFQLGANPDVLTFYSGEVGHRYVFKDRVEAAGQAILTFRTARENGTQVQSLKLRVSSDFNGVVKGDTAATLRNLSAAAWDDISDRALWASEGEKDINSGDIDLSDYAAAAKPIFIAFQYQVAAGSVQDKWTINSFLLKNKLEDGTAYTIANMNTSTAPFMNYGVSSFSPGFAGYTIQNTYQWAISSSQLVITGATSTAWATDSAEAWVFIGPINLRKVTPDIGTAIKGADENINGSIFSYLYRSKGVFEAIFTGGSVDVERETKVSKSIRMHIR
ncbi:DUF5017 domain-containing protein [Olivibacter domesticus]|nr:DUF5017 domain-containing protein [Olivibacter domesticus]